MLPEDPGTWTPVLQGLALGAAVAIVAGAVDLLWVGRRRASSRRVPGCLMYALGLLALLGVIAVVASITAPGGLVRALWIGAGVIGGFYGVLGLGAVVLLVARSW